MSPWQTNPSRYGSTKRNYHVLISTCCVTRCLQGPGDQRRIKAPGHAKNSGKNRKKIQKHQWNTYTGRPSKKSQANSPQGKQQWILKHSTGQCGVGRMLQRRKYQEHSLCPRCGAEDKTTMHVIQCQAVDARQQWKMEIKALRQWFITTATEPDLQHAIFQRLEE